MIDETLKQERKDLIWLLEEGGRSPSLEDLKKCGVCCGGDHSQIMRL